MVNCSIDLPFYPEQASSGHSIKGAVERREVSPEAHSLAMAAVCGLIAFFSFVGNLLLCVVIFLRRRSMLAKPYNVLIFNLAVTDMLTGKRILHLSIILNKYQRGPEHYIPTKYFSMVKSLEYS